MAAECNEMTKRLPCPPAPGPLEDYANRFDEFLGTLAQRRGFREYLTGLLLPRDRNKTLTSLTGAEPIVGAQAAPVQSLQFFLRVELGYGVGERPSIGDALGRSTDDTA